MKSPTRFAASVAAAAYDLGTLNLNLIVQLGIQELFA